MAHVHPSPLTFEYSHLQVNGNYTVSIGMPMDDTIKLCFAFAPRIKSLKVRSLYLFQIGFGFRLLHGNLHHCCPSLTNQRPGFCLDKTHITVITARIDIARLKAHVA